MMGIISCTLISPTIKTYSTISHTSPSNSQLQFPITLTSKPPTNYCSQLSSISVSRRTFLPSVSGIWDALTGASNNNNPREAALAIRRGMQLFRQGDVMGSVAEFDRAIELDPRQKAYLWQRGLSLYYLGRFEEGADQFRLDVAQNPNDTEESIWCFLCEARLYGVDEARNRFLEVGRDSRPVMRQVYDMFKDGGDPQKYVLMSFARLKATFKSENIRGLNLQDMGLVDTFSSSRDGQYFYASLYAGLYHEALGEEEAAKNYLVAACQSPYGERSDDYMASLAKVHCKSRNWSLTRTST